MDGVFVVGKVSSIFFQFQARKANMHAAKLLPVHRDLAVLQAVQAGDAQHKAGKKQCRSHLDQLPPPLLLNAQRQIAAVAVAAGADPPEL